MTITFIALCLAYVIARNATRDDNARMTATYLRERCAHVDRTYDRVASSRERIGIN